MPRILFLTQRAPYPPDKGDRIRAYHLLRYLNAIGDVWLGAVNDEDLSVKALDVIRELTVESQIIRLNSTRWLRAGCSLLLGGSATEGAFASAELGRCLRSWHRQQPFDVVVAFCSSMAVHARRYLPDVPLVVDLVDVDSEKWFDYSQRANFLKRRLYQLEGVRVRKLERALGDESMAVALTTEPEAELYRSIAPEAKILAIANGVDSNYFRPMPEREERPHSCVFVGAMDYLPNVEAVVWFCREIWPQLRSRFPAARFTIVGRSPTAKVLSLANVLGVNVTGGVPDVRTYVAEAQVSVAPLFVARGVQNKVLEALSMGRAVVASRQAITGINVKPGLEAIVADSPAQWVETIDLLWRTNQRRTELGEAGRRFVLANHAWESTWRALDPFLLGRTNRSAAYQASTCGAGEP